MRQQRRSTSFATNWQPTLWEPTPSNERRSNFCIACWSASEENESIASNVNTPHEIKGGWSGIREQSEKTGETNYSRRRVKKRKRNRK